MGIGLVGKPNGVRIVTGSEHYGMRAKEASNLQNREFPTRKNGRSIMVIGQTVKQEIEIIQPVAKPKKTRAKKAVV